MCRFVDARAVFFGALLHSQLPARDGRLAVRAAHAAAHAAAFAFDMAAAASVRANEWLNVRADALLASFSVVRRGLSPAYEAPYTVALVDLAEGPRMMSVIIGCEPEAVTVGAPVTVCFEQWSEDLSLPVFRLDETGGVK